MATTDKLIFYREPVRLHFYILISTHHNALKGEAGSTCVYVNDWYSQCQPGGSNPNPPSSTTTPGPTPTGGLDARIKAKGKRFWGSCADPNTLNKSANVARLRSDFGLVTPENSMKWDAIEPSRGSFNWGNADTLVNWATSNGKLIRGHTLVWHSQLPSWVSNISDRNTLTTVIQNHIAQVAGRYRGKLHAVRIIISPPEWISAHSYTFDLYHSGMSEIFEENGSFRNSVFYRVLGESFVTLAFQAARSADGSARLYINDYNLDSNNAKAQAVVNLVRRLNGSGRVIDGIGTQMHLGAGQVGGITAALTLLASAGVDVAITELDIAGASSNDYTTVVRACLAQARCESITTWGVADVDSWRASSQPLLFDNNYNPKPAYNAVLQALA
ncbi:hypothetical protein AX16_001288 [Volvariella volvacea WC 439]|nr:hypothetical protein AX16_001288 [Volvariella volvacea WC 439]